MSPFWLAASWDAVRASGFTAYGLVTLSVVLGLLLSRRVATPRWPRAITYDLHNFVSLVALAFGVVHGIASYLDPFMRFGVAEVLLPFASHYRPLWMAFGIVALYLMVAVLVSSWLRPRLGYAVWRGLHGLTFLVFAFATVHGLGTGSDSRTAWGVGVYALSVALVLSLLLWRLLAPVGRAARPRPTVAGLAAAACALLVGWSVDGPLLPGWNAVANDGHGSGARIALASATAAAAPAPWAGGFQAAFRGMLSVTGDGFGNATVTLTGQFGGRHPGRLTVRLLGAGGPGGSLQVYRSEVSLADAAGTTEYAGEVTASSAHAWRAVVLATSGAGAALALSLTWTGPLGRTVTGTLTATPAAAGAGLLGG